MTEHEVRDRDIARLAAFVQAEFNAGRKHTGNSLEERRTDLRMTQKQVRAAVENALQAGALQSRPLPKDEVHGRRTTYLVVPEGVL
jgi:hypothetical protein